MSNKLDPLVCLVVPIHNGIQHTMKFLESVASDSYARKLTIIIDDGSTDGSTEKINELFPDVVVLQGDGSLWWSGATNVGVKYAQEKRAKYILTINNDVVLENGYIESLLHAAKQRKHALIGSVVAYRNKPKEAWFSGADFNKKKGEMQHREGFVADYKSKILKSEWLTGMGVLIPIGVFNDIGYYDEKRFPQYFGDSDFSLRAKEAGWELLVNGDSVIYADVSSSWLSNQLDNPNWKFYFEVLFSIKSNYNIKDRYTFYHRHWPTNWKRAFMKFYLHFFPKQLYVFTKALIKKGVHLG